MSYLRIKTLPNTYVTIINNEDNYSFEDYTDNTGTLEFKQIPLGEYTIKCDKEGYEEYTCKDNIIVDKTCRDIIASNSMIPTLSQLIRVQEELIINTQLPDTHITLTGNQTYTQDTNNQKIAVFNDIPYDTYTLTVEKPGYYTYNTSTILNENNTDPREIRITLTKIKEESIE